MGIWKWKVISYSKDVLPGTTNVSPSNPSNEGDVVSLSEHAGEVFCSNIYDVHFTLDT